MANVGGGLYNHSPEPPPSGPSTTAMRIREIVFWVLMLSLVVAAAGAMALPTFMLLTHIGVLIIGMHIGFWGGMREKRGRYW